MAMAPLTSDRGAGRATECPAVVTSLDAQQLEQGADEDIGASADR